MSAFVIMLHLRSLTSIWINVIKVAFYHGSLALLNRKRTKHGHGWHKANTPNPLARYLISFRDIWTLNSFSDRNRQRSVKSLRKQLSNKYGRLLWLLTG